MYVFSVSDKDKQNFPKNQAELEKRFAEVESGLPQQGNNFTPFVIPAFTLFKDCGLINQENIDFLCNNLFIGGVKMNPHPLGGVLRHQDLELWTYNRNGTQQPRYYYCGSTIGYVEFEGTRYYISNDWFAEHQPRPTKDTFYNWLKAKCQEACNRRWANASTPEPSNFGSRGVSNPVNENPLPPKPPQNILEEILYSIASLDARMKNIEQMFKGMCCLVTQIDNRTDKMDNEISDLKKSVEELKNIWK